MWSLFSLRIIVKALPFGRELVLSAGKLGTYRLVDTSLPVHIDMDTPLGVGEIFGRFWVDTRLVVTTSPVPTLLVCVGTTIRDLKVITPLSWEHLKKGIGQRPQERYCKSWVPIAVVTLRCLHWQSHG
jgi:hypothetical protein